LKGRRLLRVMAALLSRLLRRQCLQQLLLFHSMLRHRCRGFRSTSCS
jgi:hypothetical protein